VIMSPGGILMARNRAAPLAAHDVEELIRGVLQRAPQPVSATQVHRALPRAGRPGQTVVIAALQAMAGEGKVHAWPGGRSPKFWTRPPDAVVQEAMIQALGAAPQSEAALRKAVTRPIAPLVKGVLARLVTSGQVFLHPPLGKTKTPLYGAAPPDPLRYLAAALDNVVRAGTKLGFDEEQVRAALARYAGAEASDRREDRPPPAPITPPADGAAVRDAILQLNPRAREGALVYVPHLRIALGAHFPDKPGFDRSLLGLLATGQIQLQAHPVPSQLSAEEKEAMVPDGRGSYYMAAGLRQR
jgi:hypothetical protein